LDQFLINKCSNRWNLHWFSFHCFSKKEPKQTNWYGSVRLLGLFENTIKKNLHSHKFVFHAYNIHHTKIFYRTFYFILCFFMFSVFQTTFITNLTQYFIHPRSIHPSFIKHNFTKLKYFNHPWSSHPSFINHENKNKNILKLKHTQRVWVIMRWWWEKVNKLRSIYFMLNFNFGTNHKYLRSDNISKMGSGVTIGSVHRFLKSQNEKPRIEPNNVGLDWFSSILNWTRQDRIFFWFGLV